MKYIKDYLIFESLSDDQFFKTKKEVEKWLIKVAGANHGYFKINKDLSVDIDHVMLGNLNLDYIPVQFRKVNNFFCEKNNLTSLKGCPLEVNSLSIYDNKLTSLEYCPKEVNNLYCNNNEITSFDYAPLIKQEFDFSKNRINTIKNFPFVGGEIHHNRKFGSSKEDNPISEILQYIRTDDLNKFIEYANEYNAIINNKVFIDNFKEALYMIDNGDFYMKNFPFKALYNLKNYTVID